ncbi:hypothetical protein A2625_07685 [candidate division WOR-1 bacterium RIFCSPHIGHO2_01_FULL_53_15]|uniref:Phospholipid/glycerol acyltransferase domain-containing protein n=1 Tax=candidate division WOR-1 bacterium RIFCSPHIGHO2_01_FULL_53_15 TaxID=1802564 RepID=A0A1F4Q4P7_UNCSA|nr:MAG: hypothetical protein A2625_07685 [candidate division WOR-1 bacterium RIFCSPHIGHO2_01_FULL_53_15]
MAIFYIAISALFWTLLQLSAVLLWAAAFLTALVPIYGGRIFYSLVRSLCLLLFATFNIRIDISGENDIPAKGRLIVVANHPGLLDQLYLINIFPRRLFFVADEGMLKLAFLGRIIKTMGSISYPRKKEESFRLAIGLNNLLMREDATLIFIDKKTNIGSIVKLSVSRGAPIIPLFISGSEKVLPKGSLLVHPGEIKVNIPPPLKPAPGRELEAIDKIFNIFNS